MSIEESIKAQLNNRKFDNITIEMQNNNMAMKKIQDDVIEIKNITLQINKKLDDLEDNIKQVINLLLDD